MNTWFLRKLELLDQLDSVVEGVNLVQLLQFIQLGSTITKISGNYNIVGNLLVFQQSLWSNTTDTTLSDPDERDWTGITTSSSFQGRTFMRRSPVNSTKETYSNNILSLMMYLTNSMESIPLSL